MPVVQFCKSALSRVPLMFTAVSTAIIAIDTILPIVSVASRPKMLTLSSGSGEYGMTCANIVLNATASVATVPPFIAKNNVHPNRKAGSGPKQSRRWT